MVEIRAIEKRFGALRALGGISLAIRPGEITSIAGPNAAGKSTLLKCIVGLVRPDAGEIVIDGRIVNRGWDYRAKIGYVPQSPGFPEDLSAEELFGFLARVRGGAPRDGCELTELFELGPALRRPLRELSGGTRQKISVVAAAMFDPEILLMDEPAVGLDPVAARRQKRWLRSEKARGKTVILASHLIAELEELSDRVAFILDGSVYFDGPPANALLRSGERTLEEAIAKMIEARQTCAEC